LFSRPQSLKSELRITAEIIVRAARLQNCPLQHTLEIR